MTANIGTTIDSLKVSFLILAQNWPLFLHLLTLQFAFAVLISSVLTKIIFDKNLTAVLSFLGGILGASLFSFFMVTLKVTPSPNLGMVIYVIALAFIIWKRDQISFSISLLKLFAFFFLILLFRLIFVQGLLVPSYADSVTHFKIVQDFISPGNPPQAFFYLSFDIQHYYHFGFHSLAAWLSGVSSTDPIHTILLLGQYFQALAVLSIYPLVLVLSRNSVSAWTALCVSGLFLPTPAYASNWGKYPAVASMIGIVFTLTLLLVHLKSPSTSTKGLRWLLGFAILSSACLHSRSVIALAAIWAAFLITKKMEGWRNRQLTAGSNTDGAEMLAPVLVIAAIISIIFVWEIGFSIWIFLALIFVFALAFWGNFFLASCIAILIIIAGFGYYAPMEWLPLPPRFGEIFDRPFLVIFFFLPASLLVWLGMEGAAGLFTGVNRIPFQRVFLIGSLMVGMINVFVFQNHHPSECCIFVDDDDLFAFAWMEDNIPKDGIIGIASLGEPGNYLPMDGGSWIEHFTGIATRRLDSRADFYYEAESFCEDGVNYIYLDDLENSFDEYGLLDINSHHMFSIGGVKIYQLPCDQLSQNTEFP